MLSSSSSAVFGDAATQFFFNGAGWTSSQRNSVTKAVCRRMKITLLEQRNHFFAQAQKRRFVSLGGEKFHSPST